MLSSSSSHFSSPVSVISSPSLFSLVVILCIIFQWHKIKQKGRVLFLLVHSRKRVWRWWSDGSNSTTAFCFSFFLFHSFSALLFREKTKEGCKSKYFKGMACYKIELVMVVFGNSGNEINSWVRERENCFVCCRIIIIMTIMKWEMWALWW